MKKILYILITFGVIGGGFFGGVLSGMVSESTYKVLAYGYLAVIILGYIILFGKKKEKKPTNQASTPQKSASTARPAAQTAHPVQTTTQQRAPQRPAQTAPKAAPQNTAKSSDGLIFKDFFAAIPGALTGLVIGFVLFFIFGLVASLTSAHPITNVFGKIAVLCLFGCTIVGYISSLKQQPKIRKENAERQAAAQQFEERILDAFRTLDTVSTSTEEGVERYGKACDFLVYAFSTYYSIPQFTQIANKYRSQCYARTYPFYQWNSRTMKYEHVLRTDLAEEVQKEFQRATEEHEAFYNKK